MRPWRFASRNTLAASAKLAFLLALAILFLPSAAIARPRHHYTAHHSARHSVARSVHHHAGRRLAARVASRGSGGAAWGSPTDPAKDAELVEDGRTGRILYT